MNKILMIFILLMMSCNNNSEKVPNDQKHIDTGQNISTDSLINMDETATKDSTSLYEFRNDSLLQRISIKNYSKEKISFELMSQNKLRNKISKLSGIASANSSQDPELDEDEQGISYTVFEYHYNKNGCSISIRVDMDSKNKVQILKYNCNKLHDESCPFGSVGVMKRS